MNRHARRCESCGRFVSRHHLKTARYYYDIDFDHPVAVYSLGTATAFQERLDCPACSMRCFRMEEAEREYGTAIGPFTNGWERCPPDTTQHTYGEAA